MTAQNTIVGKIRSGLGIATKFMQSTTYQKMIAKLTSLQIVPGTLNVQIDASICRDKATYVSETHPDFIRQGRRGMWIWPVLISGLYDGFAIQAVETIE